MSSPEPGPLDAAVTVAMVSDALDAVGLRDQVVSGPLVPVREGLRFCGPARTVQFAPVEQDSDRPYDDAIDVLDAIAPGDVVVVATGASTRSAFWGELFSAAALGRRAAGLVCDGPVRDVARIRELGLPVVSAGTRPVDFRARMRVVASQRPVRLGGVLVSPGDLVVADDDGVVVVPATTVAEVAATANHRASAERQVLADLLGGDTVRAVWQRYGVL